MQANNPSSLSELARGLSCKYQQTKNGCKEVFNNSVFGFLHDYKINQAKKHAYEKRFIMKQFSEDIGNSSDQYFSTFKENSVFLLA
ncbi:hypothetical protein DHW03_15125 [Pedobacter yonginense]|uniref:Uncharacterized protein n=1 Tax=Pedobacter yonginense TaxID=651869 RepID=A0A317EJ22_9SPHI|nr:hypothetical protein DHW03_15125 [Pedobacter yonginense]